MCGFAGFIAYGDSGLDIDQRRRILESMGRAMAHRGPDDQQFYDDGVMSLVFRRLTIMGTAEDRQPIFNESRKLLLVCNGEIYNHAQLRRDLEPKHRFATQSDSEVMLHAYEEWGEESLNALRGMFAAAIWDRQHNRLFLARDRLGIKPLYVCELPSGLLFGSELKALLAHPQCPRQTEWSALSRDPLSLVATPSYVKGIEHLAGGSYLIAQPGSKPAIEKYWRLEDYIATERYGSDARQYCAQYDHLIQEATLEHLQGQGPVGIHLSGGLDSALLTAIVGREKHDALCFTIVERTSYLAGDVKAAQGVARSFALPWHPVLFNYQTLLDNIGFNLEKLEHSVWMMDSPLFDIEWIIKAELNRKIRTQLPDLKILLMGQGADEFAGGYSKRVDRPFHSWEQYLSQEVMPGLQAQSHSPDAFWDHLSPYHRWMQLMVRQLQHHNLWHEDRTSSMYGMEARVPFLDHRLVELLASIPERLHKELFWDKQIVRACMKKHAPDYDSTRHKVGFCWTNDSRTLEMIIHQMASLLSQEFQDKYMDAPDFLYDQDETLGMMRRVRAHAPGFFKDSVALLSRMTATIFNSQHARTERFEHSEGMAHIPSGLEVVRDSRWASLHMRLESEPAMPFTWRDDYCICAPAGAQIVRTPTSHGDIACALLAQGEIVAEIRYPETTVWVTQFFDELERDESGSNTIGRWARILGVSVTRFTELLDTLLQCGFITRPQQRNRD